MPVVSVFGGGLFKEGNLEYDAAFEIGKKLSDKHFDIATGAYGGIMEAALKGAANNNVRRIGVTTEFYKERQVNQFITEEIKTENYLDRLKKLVEISDAFVVLPGETGTLLELAAIWTLKEKGIIGTKPLVCLGDQWNEVIQTMSFYSERLLDRSHLIEHYSNVDDAVSFIVNHFNHS